MSMNNDDENTVYVSYWNQLGLGILIFPSNLEEITCGKFHD